MDYNLGGEPAFDGMQPLVRLRQQYSRYGIVVYIVVRNPALLHAIRQIGVTRIVSRDDDFAYAGHVVIAAVRGVHYDSSRILEELGLGSDDRNGFGRLGACEWEVLRLYIADTVMSDVIQMLGSGMKTVGAQKAVALCKSGLMREIDLSQYARANGLTAPR